MTELQDGVLALVVAVLLDLAIAAQVRARAGDEGPFLLRIYWWTLALRYALAIGLNVYAGSMSFAGMFWGDSNTYDAGGYGIALYWQGDSVALPGGVDVVGRYGFYYFVAAIYFVFGRNQLLVQFLNGTIGAITVVLMYALAARLFDRVIARRVAVLTAFFPGMVFWSAGMYKDPAILLCIVAAMYAVVRLREELSPTMVLLFVAAVLALVSLRFYIAYFVIFATLTSFVFSQRGSFVKRILSYGLVVGALWLAFTAVVRQEAIEEQKTYATLERLQLTRHDQARLGQSAFGREYDVSTPEGALLTLPVGLTYLLFAPFPWAIAGTRQVLVLPEMIVWYGLMPSFVVGLALSIRRQLGDVLPILIFAVTLTLAYALMQGNIGTAYRQRTQITVFFFLFIGVGLVERAKRKALARAKYVIKPAVHRAASRKPRQGSRN
jgi:4-amino-4-deoxy-L-arabinose transferase-like glycosyltransferase